MYSVTYRSCPDPYAVPADTAPPGSADEAHASWQAAYDESELALWKFGTVPWITALQWTARGDRFSVRADISELLANHGDGVYTVIVWGNIDGDRLIISQYSIFHGVVPPETYGMYAEDAVESEPTPTVSPTATATATTVPVSSRRPSPTATATAKATATATSIPVDPNRPNLRHLDLKRYVLELINDLRRAMGKDPVVLGENVAAQLHAESMLADCFASHWGADGLKPHMRYALAGGKQLTREDVSGLSHCHTDAGSLPPYDDLRAKIEHTLGNSIGDRQSMDKHPARVPRDGEYRTGLEQVSGVPGSTVRG